MQHIKHFLFKRISIAFFYSFVFLFSYSIQAQKRSFGTLPLMENGEVIGDQNADLNDTEDYEHLVTIYDKLVSARGDLRYRVPKLFLRNQEKNAAYIDYGSLNITIEKKAYDAAKAIGDHAIAYLLSHELTHYYEKHAWKNQFARENADLSIGSRLNKIDDDVIYETEADYLGGFLSYTAGYGLFDQGSDVINALYNSYALPDTMDNYPTRQERIELYNRSTKKLESLIDAFDMANYLLAIGRNDDAYRFYDYVLKYYQSRELYNNLGVSATLGAMQLFRAKDLKYMYPTELDVKFKGSRNIKKNKKRRKELLNQAILHYNAAINLDPDYAPAYLNKAIAYALTKEWKKATFYLVQEGMPVAEKNPNLYAKTLIDMKVLQGIIAANKDKEEAARVLFEEAAADGSEIAKQNLAILNGNPSNAQTNNEKFEDDDFGAINLDDFFFDPIADENKIVKLTDNFTFFQSIPNSEDYRIYFTIEEDEEEEEQLTTAIIFATKDASYTTKQNIGIGASAEDIEAAYGTPKTKLETTIGQYWIYNKKMFILENNTLKRFINYDTRIL